MNPVTIGHLVRLRYQLLWAKTRSRNGRIALFLAGYLLLVLLISLLASGGFGAALLAVRSGRAEKVAQAVLAGLFVEGVLAANILGFGMNAVFADTELRRYPLNAREREMARHLTGILDPFWFLFLALELGLALGLYGIGKGSFWFGFIGVLLLFVSNYLVARVVGLFIDHLMQRKGGAPLLLLFIMMLGIAPSTLGPWLAKHPEWVTAITQPLRYTPPFGAAAAMIHPDMVGVYGLGIILTWIVGLGALLSWMEKHPPRAHVAENVKIVWDTPFDRVAALFGPRMAPLVAHWLRFYARNPRMRTLFLMSVPLLAFLTFQSGRRMGPQSVFVAALGTVPVATFLGTSRFSVNQFGYVGGGFRRFFLFPMEAVANLRAGSYASLTYGGSMIPVALVAFTLLSPYTFDIRMPLMLICTGLTGLFVLNALGIWVTLYNPRKGNYNSNFGNDLSLGGNILLIGGVMCALMLPRLAYRFQPWVVAPQAWWVYLMLPPLAFAFYLVTMRMAGPIFISRREYLLAVVEGRL